MGRIFLLLLIALFAGVLAAGYYACLPQNLEEITGYRAEGGEVPRDLVLVMKKSLEMGHSLSLTEAEINRWLAHTLTARQGGFAARWVSLDGVWVRLMDGHAEIIQERRVMGRRFTVSVFVNIERREEGGHVRKQAHMHCGPYHEALPHPVRGGRFGRLVVPQGFLVFVLPSYRKLAEQFPEEIKLGFVEMSSTTFEKGRLILNPYVKPQP